MPEGLRLLYGGSFDPVHLGHLQVARHAHRSTGATVWLMPASDPPHKPPTHASAAQRLAMCRLAVADEAGLAVEAREAEATGPSWTVDTLESLRGELGNSQPIALLLGADSFLGLPGWKRWEALPALAHFVVAQRPGSVLTQALPEALAACFAGRWVDSPAALRTSPAGRVWVMQQPQSAESSSGIRQAIAQGDTRWRDQVPGAVASYIEKNGLYGLQGEGDIAPT